MATDPTIPADVYQAARAMFTTTAVEQARVLQERANGATYTLHFGPIVDQVVDLVWAMARGKSGTKRTEKT